MTTDEPVPPHNIQPGPQLPKPVSGTLWVLLTLAAVFCGLPLMCWLVVLVFGGIGSMTD